MAAEAGAASVAQLDITSDESVEEFFARQPEWDRIAVSAASVSTGSNKALSMADALASMNSEFWGASRMVSGGASVRPFPHLSLELRPVRVNCVRTEADDHMEPQKREQFFEKLRSNFRWAVPGSRKIARCRLSVTCRTHSLRDRSPTCRVADF